MSRKYPITCQCSSRNVEFTTEYHKCIWLRFFATILGVLPIVTLVTALLPLLSTLMTGGEVDWPTVLQALIGNIGFIALTIGWAIMKIIIFFTEAKTHVVAICRDCGRIWRLN